jgi:hypothetical protein
LSAEGAALGNESSFGIRDKSLLFAGKWQHGLLVYFEVRLLDCLGTTPNLI